MGPITPSVATSLLISNNVFVHIRFIAERVFNKAARFADYLFFLTSALDEGEWQASRPGRFIPGEGIPSTNRIGGWVGPRASLDFWRKVSRPCRDSNPI